VATGLFRTADFRETDAASFAPALRRYFAKRAAGPDVEDLVQDVLVRMQSRRAESEIDNLQGYIFTVAANVLKERRSRPHWNEELDETALGMSDGITPERIVAGRMDVARLLRAIDKLPSRTREVFVAHRFEDMTYGAIASVFGISVSSVEKHIMAALRNLAPMRDGRE
jgi:RNA polymerase sigma factor (sigma-70 family)